VLPGVQRPNAHPTISGNSAIQNGFAAIADPLHLDDVYVGHRVARRPTGAFSARGAETAVEPSANTDAGA
jgi:hypothetical protein